MHIFTIERVTTYSDSRRRRRQPPSPPLKSWMSYWGYYDHVKAAQPYMADIDERVNVVENRTLIDHIRNWLLNRSYEAQTTLVPILESCIGVVAEPVQVTEDHIEVGWSHVIVID